MPVSYNAEMAPVTLFRFQIELSDVDRGVYESLDFRAARHPSETDLYLITRVLAFALNSGAALEFSPGGLSDPDQPALRSLDANGCVDLCIEIGNPAARRLHRATKGANRVKVYTYKDPELLLKEIRDGDVHKANEIEIYSFGLRFLESLAATLEKTNAWSLLHHDGNVTVSLGERAIEGEVRVHNLSSIPN